MFIIMKKTRAVENPTRLNAYRGPACDDASVEPGQVYTSESEAVADAALLTNANPVGFVVLPLKGG
jgi:hypothetical protein